MRHIEANQDQLDHASVVAKIVEARVLNSGRYVSILERTYEFKISKAVRSGWTSRGISNGKSRPENGWRRSGLKQSVRPILVAAFVLVGLSAIVLAASGIGPGGVDDFFRTHFQSLSLRDYESCLTSKALLGAGASTLAESRSKCRSDSQSRLARKLNLRPLPGRFECNSYNHRQHKAHSTVSPAFHVPTRVLQISDLDTRPPRVLSKNLLRDWK